MPKALVDLGAGERETILVAREKELDCAILDDLEARRRAGGLGIRVMGTLGLLVLAKEEGLISTVDSVLNELQAAGMWFSEEIRQHILMLADEG